MHDIRAIRENPETFDAALARRGIAPQSPAILALDEKRRACIHGAETAQAEQNASSKLIGAAKANGDDAEFERLRSLVADKKAQIAQQQAEAKALDAELTDMLMGLDNLPFDDTPDGADEADNVELHRRGTPTQLDFDALEHFESPAVKSGMDLKQPPNCPVRALSCSRAAWRVFTAPWHNSCWTPMSPKTA